jgi:hypothetical protein
MNVELVGYDLHSITPMSICCPKRVQITGLYADGGRADVYLTKEQAAVMQEAAVGARYFMINAEEMPARITPNYAPVEKPKYLPPCRTGGKIPRYTYINDWKPESVMTPAPVEPAPMPARLTRISNPQHRPQWPIRVDNWPGVGVPIKKEVKA